MNKSRRDLLRQALELLATAEEYVNSALDEEQGCLDNMPENLEGSERYERMELAVEKLEEAAENISGARDCIDEAING